MNRHTFSVCICRREIVLADRRWRSVVDGDSASSSSKKPALEPRGTRRLPRKGLSLLEVILALTILSIAMALLGELISVGARSGASARDLTRAQLYCESKMAEYAAGLTIPVSASETEYESDAEWEYSVDVQNMGTGGLIAVTVTVQERRENNLRPISYTMTRWMPDPNVEWPTEFFEDAEAETL